MNDPDKAPAFRLAEAGYDVWLGNNRGTTFSRKHEAFDAKKDRNFWDFSFAELGMYDATAQIDYVREVTGLAKVAYIGHSQGTTQMFYALAKKAAMGRGTAEGFWKERISIFVALNPVVSFRNTEQSLIKWASKLTRVFGWPVLKYAMFPSIMTRGQSDGHLDADVYDHFFAPVKNFMPFYYVLEEFVESRFNPSNSKYWVRQYRQGHFPNGASFKSIVHYGQLFDSGQFTEFDYGRERNSDPSLYGSPKPPQIDLTKIEDIPIALFVADQDTFASLADARWLREQLRGVEVYYEEYQGSHTSFQLGLDMSYFENVLTLLEEHL